MSAARPTEAQTPVNSPTEFRDTRAQDRVLERTSPWHRPRRGVLLAVLAAAALALLLWGGLRLLSGVTQLAQVARRFLFLFFCFLFFFSFGVCSCGLRTTHA